MQDNELSARGLTFTRKAWIENRFETNNIRLKIFVDILIVKDEKDAIAIIFCGHSSYSTFTLIDDEMSCFHFAALSVVRQFFGQVWHIW